MASSGRPAERVCRLLTKSSRGVLRPPAAALPDGRATADNLVLANLAVDNHCLIHQRVIRVNVAQRFYATTTKEVTHAVVNMNIDLIIVKRSSPNGYELLHQFAAWGFLYIGGLCPHIGPWIKRKQTILGYGGADMRGYQVALHIGTQTTPMVSTNH